MIPAGGKDITESFRYKSGLTAPDLISCYGMITLDGVQY